APRGGGARVGRRFHRPDISAHDRGDEARVDFLPTDEYHVGRLAHRFGRFDHADEAARLDHAERVAKLAFVFVSHLITLKPQSTPSHYTSKGFAALAGFCVFYVIRPRAATGKVPTTSSPSTKRTTSTRSDTTQQWV